MMNPSADPEASTSPGYLRIYGMNMFVRDIDVALPFYVEQLGFRLVMDTRQPDGRWAAIAPPDGTAILALAEPPLGSLGYDLIGRSRSVILVTEDIYAKFNEWSRRGVRFSHTPRTETWGGISAGFEDPDGNWFMLVGHDDVSREIEAERRAAQEVEIAKQVQARMFPQILTPFKSLDYAGVCLQARPVGGDYYDFINLGGDGLALVVADVSGKGMAAALLMASLHATLRSQRSCFEDQQQLLKSVNQFFCENTADNVYVTLFLGQYDERRQRLRYTNCGHLSAILLRADNSIELLESTSTVLGLFHNWECSTAERELFPGDILALYTDGLTEALNGEGEEFGERRLTEALQRHPELPAGDLVSSVVDQMRRFSRHEQHDDITLLVAKCIEKGLSASGRTRSSALELQVSLAR
jgi:catechol 2,3-dioxygenase-like lactoylglutathione lyase family enzyme